MISPSSPASGRRAMPSAAPDGDTAPHGGRYRALPLAALAAALALVGCNTGPSSSSKKTVNALLAAQNWAAAEAHIIKAKESQYKKKNQVLYYLDLGGVQHHAGKYVESDLSLDAAEKRMEELYTKSITKAAGMMVLNDGTVDYAGEPFERALTNVYRSFNWLHQGKLDEALVEVRKVGVFLQELNQKLEGKTKYKDDAFAQYISALLYADAGKMDDARISMQAAQRAYEWYATEYNTPMPKWEFPDDPKKQNGELVFIHYNGIAPRKIVKSFQVAWGNAMAIVQSSPDGEATDAKFKQGLAAGITGHAITVAYPEYTQDPYQIVSSDVVIDSQTVSPTLLMEDISAIARKTLDDRMAIIKTRAIARATVKFVIAEAVARAAAKECDRISNAFAKLTCKTLARGTAHGIAAATETADTRAWSTLPSQIRMARVKVPPGTHSVQVLYKNAAGVVIASKTFDAVQIARGKRTYLHHRTAI